MTSLLSLWRALTVFRWATLLWSGALVLRDHQDFAQPRLALAVLAVMVAWTVATTVLYERARRAAPWALLGADLGVGLAVAVSTAWVVGAERVAEGAGMLPGTWSAAPVAAWAIAAGPWWGGAAGAVMGSAGVVVYARASQQMFSELVLFLLVGGVGGFLVRLARRGAEQVAHAVELQAATAERERLAREIHDEVLQALALINRRGREAGGVAAELAALADEQERVLRRLVARPPVEVYDGVADLRDDLRSACAASAVPVEFSAPGDPVLLPAAWVRELAAAVTQALDNVARHAGPLASAWVLVDDDGAEVSVTVRDDGVGCSPDDIAAAERAGRLGLAQSMRGRVLRLGGTMLVDPVPGQGVEVELRVRRG